MVRAASGAIQDRYDLEVPLGKGGMGVVWRAHDRVLGRPVAVKEVELPPTVPDSEREAIQERVLREARAAAALNHANAITVYDVIKVGDRSYIVMELVDEPTLDERVKRRGPVDPLDAAKIGAGVAAALEAAHAAGITHRDVKPGNVMLDPDGAVKLADFGIASIKGDPRITATGLILGSPAYMAPEQAIESTAGAASDLYSLGATLFYAVEGKPPFDRGQAIATLTAVVHEDPPRPAAAGPLIPVIEALMRKDPARRPTAAQARALLEAVASGDDVTTVASAAIAPPTEIDVRDPAPTEAAGQRRAYAGEERPAGRRTVPWLGVAVAALVALALALFLWMQPDDRSATDPGSARDRGRTDRAADTQGDDGTTDDAGDTADAAAEPPSGWTAHVDPSTGYRIDVPEDWTVSEFDGSGNDFTDPATGAYLRLDWTDTPGPDAYERLEQQAASFGDSHGCYENLGVEPTSFAGTDNAAVWEYSYCDGGAQLHAYNLQFVLPDGSYGFALNLQAREDQWAEVQDEWERFQTSFVPPS